MTGTNGSLKDYYKLHGGATAYRGMTVPTFPNLFIVLGAPFTLPVIHWTESASPKGPNVASGHGSAVFTEEIQAQYIAKMIKPILLPGRNSISSLTIKEDVCDKYNDDLQEKLGKTVWNSCVSYYNQNEVGKKNVGKLLCLPCATYDRRTT